jgi:hypothetical protein
VSSEERPGGLTEFSSLAVEQADEAAEGLSTLGRGSTSRAARLATISVAAARPGSATIDHHVMAFAAYRPGVIHTEEKACVQFSDMAASSCWLVRLS